MLAIAPLMGRAAPYADMVMDARSGEVLHATNADSRLHPASLTKMMTLYIAFEAIRLGEISLDTMVTISPKAAAEPPSKLGLRAGQRIQLRYLIRAAAVKSANDAATAIGEAIEGSEAAFARRMNRTAKALGMSRTTFRNAHGLTEEGHLSTARDMTTLGRHLFYDYPQYYNIFSRRSTDAGITEVNNTNRRFLDAYPGADGIKTGYTRAAGFNLVASAERRGERIIATVFGGTSTANRNAKMAELLDLGFRRAPTRVAINRPALPRYDAADEPPAEIVVAGVEDTPQGPAGKIIRVTGAVARSPAPRPRGGGTPVKAPPAELLAAIETNVAEALASVAEADPMAEAVAEAAGAAVAEVATETAELAAEAVAALEDAEAEVPAAEVEVAAAKTEAEVVVAFAVPATPPRPRPASLVEPPADAIADQTAVAELATPPAEAQAETADVGTVTAAAEEAPFEDVETQTVEATTEPSAAADLAVASVDPIGAALELLTAEVSVSDDPESGALAEAEPAPGPEESILLASAAAVFPPPPEPVIRPEPNAPEVVTRLSTSGGRHSGVSLGRYASRHEAEKVLITMSLSDMAGLGGALRKVVQRGGGFEANFMGMSEEQAALACRRITARGQTCTTIGN